MAVTKKYRVAEKADSPATYKQKDRSNWQTPQMTEPMPYRKGYNPNKSKPYKG